MSRLVVALLMAAGFALPARASAQHRRHARAEQGAIAPEGDAGTVAAAGDASAVVAAMVPTPVADASVMVAPATAAGPSVTPAPPADAMSVPIGKGLPVVVRTGLFFVEVPTIDENAATFGATVDLRLRWEDPRLRTDPRSGAGEYVEYRGAAAEARLGEIWSPEVRLSNLVGDASHQSQGLRVYPDGRVELMRRTSGQFSTTFDTECFPFDRQKLAVALLAERENLDLVTMDYRQDDLDFSRVSPEVRVEGWTPGLVTIWRDPIPGWHGESHARLWVALEVERQSGKTAAAIFIPLFASLLIPLLAMWLNKWEDGGFKIEAFELANVIVGGLFAVIALNFTVMGEFKSVSGGDNTVTRLFGLNYLTLGLSLVVNLALFRFNLAERLFGKSVQRELFYFLAWAVPLLATSTAVAVLLAAVA